MHKKILSVILCLLFLLTSATVHAAEAKSIEISSPEEFLSFAESCRLDSYSQDLTVILTADIDLEGQEFESIPIFSGTFQGNGHTVSGLSITTDGSYQGLFRYLTATAAVLDLNVSGQIHPAGSQAQVGGIAGSNAGLIQNCSFEGTVSGGDGVGGLTGINAVTGIIENCHVEGDIHGSHFVGGIAGKNSGVIRNCVNNAQINTTAQQNTVGISDITMDTLTNSEAFNTVTDIGGIAGESSGLIRGCENNGNIGYQYMGYNIGGIAGTQSGYISDCTNHAAVRGRKEVGGIVGQMEPVSVIAFSEDTLQILQGQLGTITTLVDKASGNAQTNASQISSQIGVLQDQARSAQDAVDSLIPNAEDPQLPDADTILAAQNTLSSTIDSMPGTLRSIAAATQATVSGLTRDLQAISSQLDAMNATISGASENLGGSITDVSDEDTAETLTGKVESCINMGSVLADINAGGIIGAIAMENDLDIEEDWEISGENSLNFQSEVRAVVLSSENRGSVTVKKQCAGGIVGWQSMGLVKNCLNIGILDGADADYIGGIAGLSSGYIRECHVKCRLSGNSYIGGIAGSASTVTDCRSMVTILSASEKLGAILGAVWESNSELSGNCYLTFDQDIGAIDGISYTGAAEPMETEAFLSLDRLPVAFQRMTVRFVFEDGSEALRTVTPGEGLSEESIPAVPQKDGYTGSWEGLDEAELSCISHDMTFYAEYSGRTATIQSEQANEQGQPILLLLGDFGDKASVSVTDCEGTPVLSDGETLLNHFGFEASEYANIAAGRCLLPSGSDLKLLVLDENDQWQEREHIIDGSYAVFDLVPGDKGIAFVQSRADISPLLIGISLAAAAVLTILIFFLIKRGKKKAPANTNS